MIKEINLKTVDSKKLLCGLSAVALLQLGAYASVFLPIHYYDVKRTEFVKLQSYQQESKIVTSYLPNEQYLWMATWLSLCRPRDTMQQAVM